MIRSFLAASRELGDIFSGRCYRKHFAGACRFSKLTACVFSAGYSAERAIPAEAISSAGCGKWRRDCCRLDRLDISIKPSWS
jgi:hypothetical protein